MIELIGKYTNAKIFADTIEEGVYQQVYDIINCKAFEGQKVVCMPDVHVGKSGPCGLVATLGNYVNPNHVGVDIGCRVSMIILDKCLPKDKYVEFERRLRNTIPTGFNINKKTVFDEKEFYKFLANGFNHYRNYWPEMLMDLPDKVTEKWLSDLCKRIGMDEGVFYHSISSLGGGNHYEEYDETEDGSIAGFSVHCGSRNFGVKICNYWANKSKGTALSKNEVKEYTEEFKKEYIKKHTDSKGHRDMNGFKEALTKYLESKKEGHIEGYLTGENMKGYLCDMAVGELYAEWNHKCILDKVADLLSKYNIKVIRKITSVHNFIDLHDHTLRKSAIRSYIGEEMLVPFNMRDGVAICEGLSNPEWLNACAHGAGRKMSRSKAKENVSMDEFKESMKNVYSTTICKGTLDESPMAYKDTNEIKDLIQETCKIKFMMIPKINIKAADGGD